MKSATLSRRRQRAPKLTTYQLWLGCSDHDLQPELVYSTTSVDDLRTWRRAVDECDYLDYQLTALVDGKPVTLPADLSAAEIMAPGPDDDAEWEAFQSDRFTVYEIREDNGKLVDRDTCLFLSVKHLLSIYVSSDPMGGYVIQERQASIV